MRFTLDSTPDEPTVNVSHSLDGQSIRIFYNDYHVATFLHGRIVLEQLRHPIVARLMEQGVKFVPLSIVCTRQFFVLEVKNR